MKYKNIVNSAHLFPKAGLSFNIDKLMLSLLLIICVNSLPSVLNKVMPL